MIDPNDYRHEEIPAWNPELVWKRVAATRKQDQRRVFIVRLLKIAATILVFALSFWLVNSLNSSFTPTSRTAEQTEPIPKIEFSLPDQTLGLTRLAPSKIPNERLDNQPIHVEKSTLKLALVAPRKNEIAQSSPVKFNRSEKVIDPLSSTLTLPSFSYIPDFTPTEKSTIAGSHSVYYFPLLRKEEVEKPTLGQVLLSLIPFRKRGRRIQTNLVMDEENGLMVNFVIRQDSIKN